MFGGNSQQQPGGDPLAAIKTSVITALSQKADQLVAAVQLQEGELGVMLPCYPKTLLDGSREWMLRVDTYGPTGTTVRKGLAFFNLTQAAQNFEIDPMMIISAMGMTPEQAVAAAGEAAPEQFAQFTDVTSTPALPQTTTPTPAE